MLDMKKVWRLPWRGKMVPHATLDITRKCNISCRACYNSSQENIHKPITQIRIELNLLKAKRNLASVVLLGGEPTLHPKIYEIISMINNDGLEVELFSNGFGVDAEMCKKMKKAGLTTLFFHIEPGQQRPDFSENGSYEEINDMRQEKSRMAATAGLTAGLTVTAYPDKLDAVINAINLTLETKEISYLLITLSRDNSYVQSLYGDIEKGFFGLGHSSIEKALTNKNMAELLNKEFGFEPFAFLGSNRNPNDPRWLSYLIGAVYKNGHLSNYASLKVSLLEKVAMLFYKYIKRKYPMHMSQNPEKFIKQLKLNALLGGDKKANHLLLESANSVDSEIYTKRVFFQHLAELNKNGEFTHCDWCPDAVLKNGNLVPICIADKEKDEIPLFRQFPELLNKIPYVSIADIPSPVERSATFAEDFKMKTFCVKRDDFTGLDYGSNKVRKLEFLLGDALIKKAKRVITYGFAGSNHTLATAIYTKKLNLKMSAILLPQHKNGSEKENILATVANNATIRFFRNNISIFFGVISEYFISLIKEGRFPYSIAPGGSSPLGVIAYINAALELKEQVDKKLLPEPDVIYVPFGSMGTAAGLSIGFEIAGMKSQIEAVRVIDSKFANRKKLRNLIRKTICELRIFSDAFSDSKHCGDNIIIRDEFIGEGYAHPTAEGEQASSTAQKYLDGKSGEPYGIKLNPTYSAKAFAAVIKDAEDGKLTGKKILFWNTFNSRDLSKWTENCELRKIPKGLKTYITQVKQKQTPCS